MTDLFTIKVILSLIVGVSWVLIATHIAETVNKNLGSFIVGLPSTAVISLLFIGLTQGSAEAVEASMVVPFSSGLYCFYFITFLLLTKKHNFLIGLLSSLAVWFGFAWLTYQFVPNSIAISILVWLVLDIISIYWVIKNVKIDKELIPKQMTSGPAWLKALITGTVISAIVIISKIAGPKWGGILATFPALTMSTMLISIKSGGKEFTRLVAKNVLISTTTMVSLFAIACYFLYPIFGIILGSVLAYMVIIVVSWPIYALFINKKNQVED